MARRKQEEPEEVTEDTEAMEEAQEEAAPAATEFVPEQTHKPKSDVYTMLLVLTFLGFLAGCIVAGREAWENYDVQFWVFNKEKKGGAAAEPAPVPATTAPTPAPGTPDPAPPAVPK
jgi:hypothetical protein